MSTQTIPAHRARGRLANRAEAAAGPCGLGRRRWLVHGSRAALVLAASPWLPAAAPAAPWRPPPLLLAQPDAPSVDPRHYLVSEKFDGVRAWWDGQRLLFRSGRPVPAPPAFLAGLPPEPLDGELWLGRRRFDELSGLVRREAPDPAAWAAVQYLPFELPGAPGRFDERVERIGQLVAQARRDPASPLRAIAHRRVPDRPALARLLAETVAAGGEGLMLHRADAPYVTGRSEVLVKLKPQLDAEAVVVAHLPGRGRHEGVLGALVVRLPDGRRLRIGTGFSDAERRDPPPVGTSVTFRYRELTPGGLPRFASFVRRWEEP